MSSHATEIPGPISSSQSVARSAGVTSIAVLASRITGLVREIALAHYFGATAAYDAYILGFRIPNLTRDLFAEGALSSAFVPTFVDALHKKSKEEAAHLANLVATAIIIVVGLLCLVGMIFAPQMVDLLAPGFRQLEGKHELAVRLTRIMCPFLLLVALAAQSMGILNACNQFALPALSSSLFNVGSLAVGLSLGLLAGPYLGIPPIEGMAWGVLTGGFIQLGSQIPSLVRSGFVYRPAIDWSHPGLRQILRLMGPAILGSAAVQINVMVNTSFASEINGGMSWLGYAFRLMQLPLGLFGVAIGGATLPAISRSAARGDMDDFRRTLSRSLGLVFLLTIPSSVGLFVLGPSIIGALFERGEFNANDTHQTALALGWFAIGLAGYSALKVLVPAFYALKDARTPMFVSLGSIGINYAVVSTMTTQTGFGLAGLALSTSAVAITGSLILLTLLKTRITGIYGRALLSSVGKIVAAAAVLFAAVSATTWAVGQQLPAGQPRYLVDLAVSIPVGLAVYYFACRLLNVEEMELAAEALERPLARLRARLR
ncbi:MAG: murein biosynthesis integral membrane protein MurJ [Acidobacteria bacterium]|nr:murein biosynthesis integral membrane protein MurJ [Acidobacteriota bacterium]